MSDKKQVFEDHLGCFGDFNVGDTVCIKLCALSLRCIVERDQNQQMEIWEDISSVELMSVTLQ